MNDIHDIPSEDIRANWSQYKDEIYNTQQYELLWDSLENKFGIDKTDIYLSIFRKFIDGAEINHKKPLFDRIHINQIDTNTLVLKGLDSEERKHIHLLCDKIGLHHESKTHPKKHNKRFLYIYKPKIWLWECTEKNPYSKSEEYYAKVASEKEIKLKQIEQKKRRQYCCICNTDGFETQLYRSVYINGLYCDDCLEDESDGDGGKLCDHKFEPLY